MTDIRRTLEKHFSFDGFRTGQEEAVQSLLGQRHTLVVMPTGAGKSLIYQLAALTLGGVTLVISPLIALMKDQVDSLSKRGIPATYINSGLSGMEVNARLQNLAQGQYRLVYVAPERLRNMQFLNILKAQKIKLLAVDEAHCISGWGHDFRPDYLQIARARAILDNPLTAALTATATPEVQTDILRQLGLEQATRIVTGFNRPNLSFEVRNTKGAQGKFKAMGQLFAKRDGGAVIIYTGTRRHTEEVSEYVRGVTREKVGIYHAGLASEERTRIQNEFIQGRLNIVCATNAFGMGIDRADVRLVIHFGLPGSLEAYYQEAGRAGRDRLPARASLFYDPKDRVLQEFFINQSRLDKTDLKKIHAVIAPGMGTGVTNDEIAQATGLHPVKIRVGLSHLERVGALEHLGDEGYQMLFRKAVWNEREIDNALGHNREHIQHRQVQLDAMTHYAESNLCRRTIILKHFGDAGKAEASECCDNSHSRDALQTGAARANDSAGMEEGSLVILRCIQRAAVKVGREKMTYILKGVQNGKILNYHHDRNPYFGALAKMRKSKIQEMLEALIESGHIKVTGGRYPVLSLSPLGEGVLAQTKESVRGKPETVKYEVREDAHTRYKTSDSFAQTGMLLREGYSPAEAAQKRGLTLGTIYSHCVRLIQSGALALGQVVPKKLQEQIEGALRKAPRTGSITELKKLLPEEIEYGMIRCVLGAKKADRE